MTGLRLLIVGTLLLLSCTTGPTETAGGSADTGNARVGAIAIASDGTAAARATVRMRSADYLVSLPGLSKSTGIIGADALTDSSGEFEIRGIEPGDYRIEITDEESQSVMLDFELAAGGRVDLGHATLRPFASIIGVVDTTARSSERLFVQVAGLQVLTEVDRNGLFVINKLPAGVVALRMVSATTGSEVALVDSFETTPGDTAIIPSQLPAPWLGVSVGHETPRGGAAFVDNQYLVSGGGPDIWGRSDGFHFVYQQVSGDCEFTAHVVSQEATDDFAKAGIMFRENLSDSSANVLFSLETSVDPQNLPVPSAMVNTRHAGNTTQILRTKDGVVAPCWLRLSRTGNLLLSTLSVDNVVWDTLGVDTLDIPNEIYAGIAVTSHRTDRRSTAVFDNVTITP